MNKILFFLTSLLFFYSTQTYSQSKSFLEKAPSIGFHAGLLSYMGDLSPKESNIYTYWKPGYGFYFEKKIGNFFGISLNGLFGKICENNFNESMYNNFETSIINVDANLLLDFDNGKIINKNSIFAPFFSLGIGFLSFNPKGDLQNKYGKYNIWDDGTIRDVSQNTPGADTISTILVRDYTYESELKDSTKNYSKTSFTLPIRFGLKFKLATNLDARIGVAYIMTFTDYLDNVADGGNDNMLYTSLGLQYNFAQNEVDERYKDFNFSSLDKIDTDGDGVKDVKDICQDTPKGVKIDSKGCPIDKDKDGVPDYSDKELNTSANSVVNSDGITLTETMILEQENQKDFIETGRRVFNSSDLSKEEIDNILKDNE